MVKLLVCFDSLVAGGVERQTSALIIGLQQTQIQPEAVAFYGPKSGASLHFKPVLDGADIPITVFDATKSPLGKLVIFLKLMLTLWQIRPDIVHTVNYHGNILVGPTQWFAPRKTRVIVSVQAENTPKQIRNQQLTWRLADHIICISPHLKQELIENTNLNPNKIHHIPNGLDVERFAHEPTPETIHSIRGDARRLLVMVTRISERKAPELLPQALGVLKQRNKLPADVQALIIGEAEDADTQARIDAQVETYALQGILKQLNQTDQIANYYHAADVTILLALRGEGLPNVILESLAAGKPVIVSEAANRADVIEHGVTGWVVRTGDVEHLVEMLAEVLSLPPEDLQKMKERCQQIAQNYSMDKMIKRHLTLYLDVLKEGSSR